mmetsp:Transcript_39479/g.117435  ORF Transcript_39479/g.117435 Transcript_39479/m.117435 type:complete len:255 (+) Transcript_39479:726-1490(+)
MQRRHLPARRARRVGVRLAIGAAHRRPHATAEALAPRAWLADVAVLKCRAGALSIARATKRRLIGAHRLPSRAGAFRRARGVALACVRDEREGGVGLAARRVRDVVHAAHRTGLVVLTRRCRLLAARRRQQRAARAIHATLAHVLDWNLVTLGMRRVGVCHVVRATHGVKDPKIRAARELRARPAVALGIAGVRPGALNVALRGIRRAVLWHATVGDQTHRVPLGLALRARFNALAGVGHQHAGLKCCTCAVVC